MGNRNRYTLEQKKAIWNLLPHEEEKALSSTKISKQIEGMTRQEVSGCLRSLFLGEGAQRKEGKGPNNVRNWLYWRVPRARPPFRQDL